MKDKLAVVEQALHPVKNSFVTVEHYLREFPGKAVDPMPRCPICHEDMRLASPAEHGFIHLNGEYAHCPLVSGSLATELLGLPLQADVRVERWQRERFVDNWRQHLGAMRSCLSGLTVRRFITVVAYADVLHLWAAPLLAQEDVPYVLLVLAGFVLEDLGTAPPTWVRFWFDASAAQIGDLRKAGAPRPRLYRFRYRQSRSSMFPTPAHLIRWDEIATLDDAFLKKPAPRMRLPEEAAFDAFLKAPVDAEPTSGSIDRNTGFNIE